MLVAWALYLEMHSDGTPRARQHPEPPSTSRPRAADAERAMVVRAQGASGGAAATKLGCARLGVHVDRRALSRNEDRADHFPHRRGSLVATPLDALVSIVLGDARTDRVGAGVRVEGYSLQIGAEQRRRCWKTRVGPYGKKGSGAAQLGLGGDLSPCTDW